MLETRGGPCGRRAQSNLVLDVRAIAYDALTAIPGNVAERRAAVAERGFMSIGQEAASSTTGARTLYCRLHDSSQTLC